MDEWVSLDIGIYSPETGFTHWSLGSLNYDYYEMYPGSVLPPFFYPDELRFSGTHLVQIVNDPTCGWCNGQYLSEYLEFGGGSTGYATVFFNNYDPISRGTLTVTHVPEPSAVGLILIVAAMLGWHSRRSRSRRPFRSPA